MNYNVTTTYLRDNGETTEALPLDLYIALYYTHTGRANKSLGNQDATLSKEQMWHVIHATVAFTLDTKIQ